MRPDPFKYLDVKHLVEPPYGVEQWKNAWKNGSINDAHIISYSNSYDFFDVIEWLTLNNDKFSFPPISQKQMMGYGEMRMVAFYQDKEPINIVLPDANPLIQLANCDSLDLLQKFGKTIAITDVIIDECIRRPDKPEANKLIKWFGEIDTPGLGHNQFKRLSTGKFFDYYEEQKHLESTGVDPDALKNFGEDHLLAFRRILPRILDEDEPVLVLSQDQKFIKRLTEDHKDIHALTTAAWLHTLIANDLIDDNHNIFGFLQMSAFTGKKIDVPASLTKSGNKSGWIGHARKTNKDEQR